MDAPKIIWLQRPNRDPDNEWCGEVTWCEDKQNDDDTCYIKAGVKTVDAIEELRAELSEFREDAERWRDLLISIHHDAFDDTYYEALKARLSAPAAPEREK